MSSHSAQPALQELMARYLKQSALELTRPDSEVLPYEAGSAQLVDARLAWEEGIAALHYGPQADKSYSPPPDWANLVAAHEPVVAVPFCTANFPQLLRNLQSVLHAAEPAALRPQPGRPTPAPSLLKWAEQVLERKAFPETLLVLGALRLAKQFDRVAEIVATGRESVPASWQAVWANEEAAVAWHQGRAEEALRIWESTTPTVPVLFNRGMALLFTGKPVEARKALAQAFGQIPDSSAWHHLGQLYLGLAEM